MNTKFIKLLLVICMVGGGSARILNAAGTTLTWDPPVSGLDGAPLNDIAGYIVHYGTASQVYTVSMDVGLTTSVSFTNLTPELTYYFAVTCYDTSGNESGFSEELVWTQPPSTTEGLLASFTWDTIPTPQAAGVPFPVTIQAMDGNGTVVTDFNGTVSLTGAGSARGIITGTVATPSAFPVPTAYHDARTQVIYLKNEIGTACTISALALNVSTVPGQSLQNWTIRLKHTALGKFTSKSVWEPDGWTTVYRTNQVVSATGWVEFVFSTPFHFNGINNLMVDLSFDNSNRSQSGFCVHTATDWKRRFYQAVNSAYGDPLTWSVGKPKATLASTLPDMRLKCGDLAHITPTVTTGFSNGVWTGDISVAEPALGLTLRADDGEGHAGSGDAFDVLAPQVGMSSYLASELPPLPMIDLEITSSMEDPDDMDTASSAADSPDIEQAGGSGIPPVVSLAIGDGGLKMGIQGTVGADIVLQSSTNIANPFAWETLQDLLLTNAGSINGGSPAVAAQGTLAAAFVPAFEWFTPDPATSAPIRFFRAVMPYNYAVLADKVLKSKGYQTRLIVVRLPAITLHDVCYVGEDQAYIASSEDHFILALNYAGSTIREIADDYGRYVKMNWTSASEFVFTQAGRQLTSTVVKTESPSSDPPPETLQSLNITVDF